MADNPYHNPYQPPHVPVYVAQPILRRARRQRCGSGTRSIARLMALLYLLCIAGGVVLFIYGDQLASDREEELQALIMGVMLPLIGAPLMLLFGTAVLLPRSKFAWILGFVTICIGLTSGCTMLPCVFLLVFWLKPETKAFLHAG